MSRSVFQRWCFTQHVFVVASENPLTVTEGVGIQYCAWQEEKCPETEKLHLQGYIEMKGKFRLSAMKKIIPSAHLEPCMGGQKANIIYCHKEETRVSGPYSYGTPLPYVEDENKAYIKALMDSTMTDLEIQRKYPAQYVRNYNTHNQIFANRSFQSMQRMVGEQSLRPWQAECLQKLRSQDDRKILWVMCEHGNSGKTWLAKYMVDTMKAFFCAGKKADIINAYRGESIVIYDIKRAEGGQDFTSYNVLETFKDGIAFNTKYVPIMRRFKSCKVVVFANFLPDTTKLSADRWDIMNLTV